MTAVCQYNVDWLKFCRGTYEIKIATGGRRHEKRRYLVLQQMWETDIDGKWSFEGRLCKNNEELGIFLRQGRET